MRPAALKPVAPLNFGPATPHAVPRLQLENGTRASLDGDILLKWTHYSQERLGPLLLFAQNSKVTASGPVWRPVLHCFLAGPRDTEHRNDKPGVGIH